MRLIRKFHDCVTSMMPKIVPVVVSFKLSDHSSCI
jgi:hypothetical protein